MERTLKNHWKSLKELRRFCQNIKNGKERFDHHPNGIDIMRKEFFHPSWEMGIGFDPWIDNVKSNKQSIYITFQNYHLHERIFFKTFMEEIKTLCKYILIHSLKNEEGIIVNPEKVEFEFNSFVDYDGDKEIWDLTIKERY